MSVLSFRRGAVGVAASAVLAATGTWVMWPADVDEGLWAEVRPVIEARIAAESRGGGLTDAVPARDARWFCRAEALELEERAGEVRAGVNALCVEYGVQDDTLVECGAGQYPQVVRLERDRAAHGGYRVVGREEPPDGEGYGRWTESHFGVLTRPALRNPMSPAELETEARAHFGLPADASVGEC
ncbi:hypothetical protein KMT30_40700 [Streptomyces sp. IBSBF 2953]|uniref:hypothetical protein n=1 Tax=Streptomyces TaxID=1883 RepID=UPI00211A0538|nr:hypothetical protein [Streptomyces scabiei]MCQ9185245.1 hypothetical protein [Streptomyces hayashii]MDX3118761.1 hypothetical protein [Streptomyces scabiei]